MSALRADGSEFPVELAITPIPTGGRPVFTAQIRDITERNRRDQRRAARLAITQTLAEAASFAEAAPRILQAVCESLEWEVGALWRLDRAANRLVCVDVWRRGDVRAIEFEAITRQRTFPPGIGLPGRVWSSGRPAWIPDVVHDANFPRAPIAAKEGLHAAFGCPIMLGREVLGVVEFFSRQIREPDDDLLEMMATIGSQIGHFMERKRAEQALQASEQRFARFMACLPGLAWIKDGDGRYVYANDAALKAFRTPPALLYGKTDEEVFPPATAAQFREHDRRALASGTSVQVIETLEHEDGILHHSIVSKFPVSGPNGGAVLIGGMAVDITDRLRAEEALKDADRRKDEFLAMLAHELRNPLAPIRSAVQILATPEAGASQVAEARQIVARQVHHMGRLVDDLLDVSRIMRGKIELRKEPVELAKVLARGIETAQPMIDARGQELVVTLPPEPLLLDADLTRLAQAFANLLHNAAKFSERAGCIWLHVQRREAEIEVRVRDEGAGIRADLLPHVFDLFVQGDRSLERTQGGLGIGLTVVRQLIELHGGTITAQSEGPGKGSEFIVRLPLVACAPSQPPVISVPGQNVPRRVLVVDDNVDAASSVAMLLRLWGHEVALAHNGPDALRLAEEQEPEVVVLDIGLPILNGYEVARQLRQRPRLRETLLIAVTGYGQADDRRRSKAAGFDHHLTKPVDLAALEALLRDLKPAC
jgi:PAS domain S-box-containing protein